MIQGSVQLRQTLARLTQHGGHLRAFERNGRALGIVLVVGGAQSGRCDDAVEVALQRLDLRAGSLLLAKQDLREGRRIRRWWSPTATSIARAPSIAHTAANVAGITGHSGFGVCSAANVGLLARGGGR